MAVRIKNSTAFVTGGTGFVGSHLIEELIRNQVRVISTTQDHNQSSYFYTKGLDKITTLIPSDIRDFGRMYDAVVKYNVDYIFHLAAQSTVEAGYENPLETFSTNIMGTANILECARRFNKVKAIIIASSDKAYGKLGKSAYKESDALRGDHPYEVSKSATDLLALTYYKTYSLPIVVTRFGNIYGEGDLHFSRLIPDIMKSIIQKKSLQIRSNGKYIRDYLYVKDVASGYVELVRQSDKTVGHAFNFGSQETLSVLDVINLTNKVLNNKLEYAIRNTSKNEIPYQSLNYTKIKKYIGWKPKYSLTQTLPEIYKWYENYFNHINKR